MGRWRSLVWLALVLVRMLTEEWVGWTSEELMRDEDERESSNALTPHPVG